MNDIIKKIEESNPLIATESDFRTVGVSVQRITDQPKVSAKVESNLPAVAPKKETIADERQIDFEQIRDNLYANMKISKEALEHLLQIAQSSQHPRAYEVLALLLKTSTDLNRDLMKIHSEKHGIENNKHNKNTPQGPVTNNNLFVGTADQLDEFLAQIIKKD